MAANGFIELLRLSKRGNKNYASVQNEAQRWSGIAFEMRGQYFVAPLGEVSEVIYPPKYTPVPNTQSWVKGLANIRGRLLSVSDLAHFISGQRSSFSSTQKVLCISHHDQYVGLVVDQVLGIQHFNKKFFREFRLRGKPKRILPRVFSPTQSTLACLLFSRLLQNPLHERIDKIYKLIFML